MIPKVVHYFWLGGNKKSILANICINSWKENLQDYEIIEWNESNLNLDEIAKENKFFAECRKRKLWAFMVDYLRLKILYEFGGIYMDTDVQVKKDFEPLMNDKAFLGKETGDYIGTGLIACEPKNETIKKILDFYNDAIWKSDLYTIPMIITEIFKKEDSGNFKIYSMEYFAPYDYNNSFEYSMIGEKTYAIHWFSGSWTNKLSVTLFLQTKHINNKIIKSLVLIKKIVGFYYIKILR